MSPGFAADIATGATVERNTSVTAACYVMEYSSTRLAIRTIADRRNRDINKMSTLTMPSHHHYHHPGFHREFAWLDTRPETSSRSRNDHERVALPSIRQTFPELQLQVQQDGAVGTPLAATSPVSGPFTGTMTPPEYVHSPTHSKRRRLSFDDEREAERANQVPRFYNSSQGVASRQQSPPSATRPTPEGWGKSSTTSPYVGNGALPSMRSPARVEVHERAEARPTLPSLPLLNLERGAPEMHRIRSHSGDDYVQESTRRPSLVPSNGQGMEAAVPGYQQANYGYGFHHPSRVQSLSVGSVHPFDRTPFSPGAYGQHFHETFMRIGEYGMGINGDSKQRKRRGNLPKETTDKLRAWFVGHLTHPYPTEDEKQDLMRQTGLQMIWELGPNVPSAPVSGVYQISNWFINARRRQLPTMISNARAESDAMTGRGGDGKIITSTERLEYDHEGRHLSDGEGANYDDIGLEATKRCRATNMKRGSI
ncbi:Uu.00g003150.m01.CDS01 [Anthostomella pinea]|uniref:Uu.00g003150.m01.CDS01 n=1 Tax=Anthostomella pinea TaxID=933095 RepID=A0AAI8VJP2_9PEZI|nr:Uu.00g003150.m01.CDS01 [Anthostomella pinea]